jgi:calcineurin-like phosphoesterase family protein
MRYESRYTLYEPKYLFCEPWFTKMRISAAARENSELAGCNRCAWRRGTMQKVFMISDHHFGHKNIIDFEARPFHDVEQMNREMIERWNSVVNKKDKVFHLGDFSFLNLEKTKDILSKLNGYKTLIMGNHDRGRSRAWWLEAGFNEVNEHPIIYGGFFFLSHEPMYMNKHMPYVNIHGHIHGLKYEGNQFVNVSVEQWDYKPVQFEAIKQMVVPSEEQ